MIIKDNFSLKDFNSFKIGGITPKLYIPENENDFIDLLKELNRTKTKYKILGNGSNVLIKDGLLNYVTISNKQALSKKDILDDGVVEIGSSCDLREVIRILAKKGLDIGLDLITIPASIGGAIYMNAGRGKRSCISDNIIKVRAFDGKNIVYLSREECCFEHRSSLFFNNKYFILSGFFKCKKVDTKFAEEKIKENLKILNEKDYYKYPSAGSIFKIYNNFIMNLLKGFKIGGAKFSSKDLNSIINIGNAKYRDIYFLILIAKFLHFVFLKKCELEIKIF